MARLPSGRFLIQLVGPDVILFEDFTGTEQEVVRFPVKDSGALARAQKVIHESPDLSDEDKCFAHFWSGYFWAYRDEA